MGMHVERRHDHHGGDHGDYGDYGDHGDYGDYGDHGGMESADPAMLELLRRYDRDGDGRISLDELWLGPIDEEDDEEDDDLDDALALLVKVDQGRPPPAISF